MSDLFLFHLKTNQFPRQGHQSQIITELAAARNEIAIYDFHEQKEIRNPKYVSGVTTKVVKNTRPEIAKTIEA